MNRSFPTSEGADAVIDWHGRSPGVTRRQALSLMAASLALANGACSAPPNERILPYVHMPEGLANGEAVYYASAFVRDGHALGVLLGTREGRPIKVEGNPSHPSSLGATDVFAQASILQLWDPDRSQAVRQRLDGRRTGNPAESKTLLPGPAGLSTWQAFEAMWAERATQLERREGEGLHLLTGPITSPTDKALLTRLRQRFPRAVVHLHRPLADDASQQGLQAAFGKPLAPVLHLDRARCVLALAADPFCEGPGSVRHAMDWSTARRQVRDRGSLPTLFSAEITPTLFGARADERIALAPMQVEALLWRVARQWMPDIAAPASGNVPTAFEAGVVQALKQAGPDALVIAGPSLDPTAHALAASLNQRLSALGRTIDFIEPPDAIDGAQTLLQLVRALDDGAVDTLVMIDTNPVYDAPAELGFDQALMRAGLTVHVGLYADETAQACDWHLPMSHDYERFGDALAHDGSATLLQPAIAPLYDTRSTTQLLAWLAGSDERNGRRLLQDQWRGLRSMADRDFEAFWRTSLRSGVIDGTASTPVSVSAARVPSPQFAAVAPLVVVFTPDPCIHDGRYANLGWLQELPRSFSKMTWDNAVQLGPRTAAQLGVHTGDVVRASVGGRSVEAPVWVSAAQAEGVACMTLGHGRRHAGRVGNDVGFDANLLRPVTGNTAALRIARTGLRHDFALTQHAIDQEGRELARTISPGTWAERERADSSKVPSLYPEVTYPEHAWAMVIDLDACIGCNACTIACQSENNIPVVGREQVAAGREMHWIRVDRYETADTQGTIFQPVPCMHCEKAPCEVVCPVGATMHDSEGLNVQVYNRCVGTRFCSNNCPYKVRRFNFLEFNDTASESLKLQRNPDVTVRQRGVMEKCTYCLQRITRARHHAEVSGEPLADGDVVTACQSACPTRAIHFGDLRDTASDVVQLRQSPRHYALLGELNTRPRTTYLARLEPERGED